MADNPIVGIVARLILKDFQREKKKLDKLLKDIEKGFASTASKATKSGASFEQFINNFVQAVQKANLSASEGERINSRLFSSLEKLSKAYDDLGGKTVNMDQFISALQGGEAPVDALKNATEGLDDSLNILGLSLGQIGVMAGAAVTGLKLIQHTIDESINSYMEYVRQARRLSIIMGTNINDAVEWVNILQLMGVRQSTAERSLSMLGTRYADATIDLLEGKEATNDFARALEKANIDMLDAAGNMRPFTEILEELIVFLGETEDASLRSFVSMRTMGLGARELSILAETFPEARREIEKYNAALAAADEELETEFLQAQARARLATQEFHNEVGREYTPAVIALKDAWAGAKRAFVDIDTTARAAQDWSVLGAILLGDYSLAAENFTNELIRLKGVQTDAEKAEDELAKARAEAERDLVKRQAAEKKYREELEETIKALDKLIDKYEEQMDKAAEARDIAIGRAILSNQRSMLDQALRLYQRLENMEDDSGKKREKIVADSERRIGELRADWAKRVRRFEEDARDRREDLEIRHVERLRKINQDYYDSVEEAARSNDAVAVLRARRQRARSLRDENIKFGIDVTALDRNLAKQRRRIDEDAQDRINREKRRARDRLNQLEEEYDEREKLERKKLQAILAMLNEEHRIQFEDLKDSKDLEAALIRLKLEQRKQDIEDNYQRQRQAAVDHYEKERDLIAREMGMTNQELDRLIRMQANTAARATYDGARQIAQAAAAGIRSVGGGVLYITVRRGGGGGLIRPRAEGGIDVVNSPTLFRAGEAGPEIAAFIPLRGNMNVNHSFGNLPVNVNGQGAGNMNKGQIRDLVWEALDYIGDRINVGSH